MSYTIDQIEEAYKNLPENLSTAIVLNNTDEKMKTVGEKFGIHVDKIGELNSEITYVLIGLARSDDFYEIMKTILGVPDDKTKEIFKEINEKIFTAVRARYEEIEKLEVGAREAREMADRDNERREEIEISGEGFSSEPAIKVAGTESSLSMAQERLMKPFKMTRAETDYSLKTVSAGGVVPTNNQQSTTYGEQAESKPNDSRAIPENAIERHSRIASDPYLAKIDEEDLKKK